jgi:hypothetical protein
MPIQSPAIVYSAASRYKDLSMLSVSLLSSITSEMPFGLDFESEGLMADRRT